MMTTSQYMINKEVQENILDIDNNVAFNIALRYYNGDQTVEQNYERAFRWFHSSAVKNHVASQFHLATLYLNKQGIPQCTETIPEENAIIWFENAARQGHEPSMEQLVKLYRKRCENIKLLKCCEKLAEKNNSFYQYLLAHQYLKLKSTSRYLYWIKESATLGYADAQVSLANRFFHGQLIEKNLQQAFYWYSCAANQEHMESMFFLAKCYKYGYGTSINEDVAENMNSKACTLMCEKFKECMQLISEKKFSEATYWLKKCVTLGNIEAEFRLGMLFENEESVKSIENAIQCYTHVVTVPGQFQEDAKFRLFLLTGH